MLLSQYNNSKIYSVDCQYLTLYKTPLTQIGKLLAAKQRHLHILEDFNVLHRFPLKTV